MIHHEVLDADKQFIKYPIITISHNRDRPSKAAAFSKIFALMDDSALITLS